jgi:hypothetical protein
MSDIRDQQVRAMEPLRAPSGHEVMERVAAERLGDVPRLHAVDPTAEVERLSELLAAAESSITEERAARKRAEASANEMAVLVARVRNELSEERSGRISAETTANEIAGLIASENERARKLEDQLRIAWAQVPMREQQDMPAPKRTLGERVKRGLKR